MSMIYVKLTDKHLDSMIYTIISSDLSSTITMQMNAKRNYRKKRKRIFLSTVLSNLVTLGTGAINTSCLLII